jgi:hypothetical protein
LSLKLKTQPIQLRDWPPFNLKGGMVFLLKKNNLMLNFEKKILWLGCFPVVDWFCLFI